MQYFEWYLKSGILWNQIKEEAESLAENGITALWIPPAYKGAGGVKDVGYAVYDLYDLGEFDQKGTVPTKYGTKEELISAVKAAHKHELQIYADVVLDHKMGADGKEKTFAKEYNPDNRNEPEGKSEEITVWTYFNFPGRKKKYSDFEWHWNHFVAIDLDVKTKRKGIFKFRGKDWDEDVDKENGNFDYLMGADIDLNNPDVTEELKNWGTWFVKTTDVDGFRLDAVKHMEFTFYADWLNTLRKTAKEELFTVGEYWNGDLDTLKNYMETTEEALSLFDVPLHFKFFDASNGLNTFDMSKIFDGTLTLYKPTKAVTFVDNHDTQPGQSLQSWIQPWFKPLAYALILLRGEGYPCVFYGDYYGIPHDSIPSIKDQLLPLLKARQEAAYGEQHDYFDHPNTIGWTREGDKAHPDSGLAVIMTNGSKGEKTMFVGKQFAGQQFYDCTGNRKEIITINDEGNANFLVNDGSVSVWRKQLTPEKPETKEKGKA